MVVPNHHVWLHSQEYCQPAIVHEVAVSASGTAVCVGVTAVDRFDFYDFLFVPLFCMCKVVNCVHFAFVVWRAISYFLST